MAATITNVSKQRVTIILDHAVFQNRESGWSRGTTSFANTRENGARQIETVKRSFAGTLSLLPGESVSGLHAAIAKCSQVPNLVKQGVVRVSDDVEEEKPEQKTPVVDSGKSLDKSTPKGKTWVEKNDKENR